MEINESHNPIEFQLGWKLVVVCRSSVIGGEKDGGRERKRRRERGTEPENCDLS